MSKSCICSSPDYKRGFINERWPGEKFKWEAIRHFQNNWDIKAPDFGAMFMEATKKTGLLLTARSYYPRKAISDFSKVDPDATRQLFAHLFDESRELTERLTQAESTARELLKKCERSEWKQNYQKMFALSTYLWLRYPDRYFIYKYGVCRALAKALDSDFSPTMGDHFEDNVAYLEFYDEVRKVLAADAELDGMLKSVLTKECHPDPKRVTLTVDFAVFVEGRMNAKASLETTSSQTNPWFPSLEKYTPGLTVEQ